ncbi:RsmD family RNA methyltransferase, partial [Candidatus Saccharibacteria bacterium]|nr:RsmD family RNA methyltransferase [Candidatus Saccharibacteria bacterium]
MRYNNSKISSSPTPRRRPSLTLQKSSAHKSATTNFSNILRIAAGTYRGRTIATPKTAHPMGSRERLALMNTLAPYLKNATVLDAFAGSGALGIEALSRGAN